MTPSPLEQESPTVEPERKELMERIGPPLLAMLSWTMAALAAAPAFLVLLLPLLS